MFMKNTWRLALLGIDKEGKFYRELHNAGVKNIAPFECAGDLGHETRAQTYTVAKWANWARKRALRRHIHYRLVLGVVGRDLTSYRSTKELVTAMRDAMIAHDQILRAGIIHRDISVGNILIIDNGRGILIDFDLCKLFEDTKKQARASERSGTWQFMSAQLQMSEVPLHPERADDLESFLHVLTWIALLYVRHTLGASELTNTLSRVFDYTNSVGNITAGGTQKRLFLKGHAISDCGFAEGPLLSLLEALTETCAARYDKLKRPAGLEARNSEKVKEWKSFEERRRRLDSSKWAITTFNVALNDPYWPMSDKPNENPLLTRIEQHAKVHTSHTQVQSTFFSQSQAPAPQNASEDRMDVDSPQSPRKTAPLPRRAQQVMPGPVPTFNGETMQDWGAASDTVSSGKRSRAVFEPPPSPSNKCARTVQHTKPQTNPR
ncbi:hypothetical protein BDN70DRAFT_938537 [Pholiota conissans]|uniref:Protein kinase domain-containing protein n=1 Tax=Pholiota conissans TaxID=109636 RepID=A0A9P5YQR7_9AGAR|nr:hypothetical protein BDN70DRAFT_938537 [Pholiota conissans]